MIRLCLSSETEKREGKVSGESMGRKDKALPSIEDKCFILIDIKLLFQRKSFGTPGHGPSLEPFDITVAFAL
jgi:hypothetical protein